MTYRKDLSVYMIGLVIGLLWAVLLSRFIDIGPVKYVKAYPATALCAQIKPGMSVEQVKKTVSSYGEPESVWLITDQLSIQSSDATCNIQLDMNKAVVKGTTMSNVPVTY